MPIASTLISDQPARVLTAALATALAQVTDVQRRLAAEGYHAKAQDLRDPSRPKLVLHHGDELLRQRLRAVVVSKPMSNGYRVVFGTLDNVSIAWEVPA